MAASSLYVSMFNLSIALGALVGGLTVDTASPVGVLWIGGVLAVLVLPIVGNTLRRETPLPTRDESAGRLYISLPAVPWSRPGGRLPCRGRRATSSYGHRWVTWCSVWWARPAGVIF
ncbi:hypothetical protein ABZV14_32805 [Streptosporangium canum]|uniref:hypothetical protein n=1 Tax=Streptosporangium canum TaxID=324952 RepID=UPI0033A66B1A